MTFVKINENLYPATISGKLVDKDWNNRASKSITLEMSHADAVSLFVDDMAWSIVYQDETVTAEPETYDNGEYCVAGSITDNRDGTVTVKMGKITAEEALAELMEVLA